ncbi:MAG: phosphate-starvation-inducible PsiE family protein [Azospirillaceae bacterium]
MQTFVTQAIRMAEKALLVAVAVMAVLAAGGEILSIVERREIVLADLLLMFLYAEVIGMAGVYYASRTRTAIFPLSIAMTAVARLLVLQSKDMAPEKIVYEAGAILLLALAIAVLSRFTRSGEPGKDGPGEREAGSGENDKSASGAGPDRDGDGEQRYHRAA